MHWFYEFYSSSGPFFIFWPVTKAIPTASIIYYMLILPIYNVILLGYGFLFGQFNFFWEFEKRFFNRIFTKKK